MNMMPKEKSHQIVECRSLIRLTVKLSATVMLSFFLSSQLHAAPSFDCLKAASPVELLICQTEQNELQMLDVVLSRVYASLRQLFSADDRALLKRSQRQWIASRDQGYQSTPVERRRRYLKTAYQLRINELENGLVSFQLPMDKIPFVFETKERGQFIFSRKTAESAESEYIKQQIDTYVQINEENSVLLFSGSTAIAKYNNQLVNSDRMLTVRLLFVPPHGLLFIVNHHVADLEMRRPIEYFEALYLLPHNTEKNLSFITSSDTMYYDSNMQLIHEGREFEWDRDPSTGRLLLVEIFTRVNNASGIGEAKRFGHAFDFERRRISSIDEYVRRDLEQEALANRYIQTMNEMLHALKGMKKTASIMNEGEALVDALHQGLFIFLIELKNRRISWTQLQYAAKKLAIHAGLLQIPDQMILLAKDLLRHKQAIEALPDWQKKLQQVINPPTGSYQNNPHANRIGYSTTPFIKQGFPLISNISYWSYGFWLRRYRKGQFESVGQLLETGLKARGIILQPVKMGAN